MVPFHSFWHAFHSWRKIILGLKLYVIDNLLFLPSKTLVYFSIVEPRLSRLLYVPLHHQNIKQNL